jgi:ADP-L-glycero-D-manno-heptose 6-epimerase
MIVVTGGCGFIGSNIIRELNYRGITDILVVDNLENGHKFKNIADLQVSRFMTKEQFRNALRYLEAEAVIHMGACSRTTEWNGNYMMDNNCEYSIDILKACQHNDIPLIYASSAAVYGKSKVFVEGQNEVPLNVYGWSKLMFDRYVGDIANVVGLRFFNVYGPGETFKEGMQSPITAFHKQLLETKQLNVFEGENKRDFIYVKDVVSVVMFFLEKLLDKKSVGGVYNVGTGAAVDFNDIAQYMLLSFKQKLPADLAVIAQLAGRLKVNRIPIPGHLVDSYQDYTCADISKLRAVGYNKKFWSVPAAIDDYLAGMDANYD